MHILLKQDNIKMKNIVLRKKREGQDTFLKITLLRLVVFVIHVFNIKK